MEVYTLDSLYRRTEVVDWFESLIWTERWAGWGDFEILIQSDRRARDLFQEGALLSMSTSKRVMRVETKDDKVNDQGQRVLHVKGRSIETLFMNRIARPGLWTLGQLAEWNISNKTPKEVMESVVSTVCVDGVNSPYDVITNLVMAKHPDLPVENGALPIDPITMTIDPTSVYKALEEIGNTWNLGFRLLLNINDGQLYFDVYPGADRTASQTMYNPVLFSPELDNLQNTTEMSTIEGAKNVAIVVAENGVKEVFALSVDPESINFERQAVLVMADDIDLPAGPDLDAALIQRGKEALAENRPFQAFDGEINQASQYLYETDYFLGDLVEVRNADGVANQMRVTEQIFVSDKEGERSYPTLALNTFINTGSWLSWATDKQWIDYDTDFETVWSSLP